jgi:hypothetical protein
LQARELILRFADCQQQDGVLLCYFSHLSPFLTRGVTVLLICWIFDQFLLIAESSVPIDKLAASCRALVTGVPGTTDRGTTNRERGRRFLCRFYLVESILSRHSRPERTIPERGTRHRSRSAVTRVGALVTVFVSVCRSTNSSIIFLSSSSRIKNRICERHLESRYLSFFRFSASQVCTISLSDPVVSLSDFVVCLSFYNIPNSCSKHFFHLCLTWSVSACCLHASFASYSSSIT